MSDERPLNLYASAHTLPPAPPSVTILSARTRSDPELRAHVGGFEGLDRRGHTVVDRR